MNRITIILTVFFTLFMTACGGGSPDAGNDDTNSGGDGSPTSPDPTEPNPTNPNPSGSTPLEDIAFGVMTENGFISGKVGLSAQYSLVGQGIIVNADIVNTQSNNTPVAESYQYEFSSTCSSDSPVRASFSVPIVGSSTGSASSNYLNSACDSADVISVSLYAHDADVANSEPLKTISTTLQGYIPQLGFGEGADYVNGMIAGQSVLADTLSTQLTANAVDVVDLNSKIGSDDYIATWTSSCAASSFSISSQSLATSDIVTRYDANSCNGTDTVTLSLYARNDMSTVLDSTSLVLTIGETAGVEVDPKLGTGSGGDFNLGQLDLSASYVLAGGDLIIGVNGVNTLNSNALLNENYLYKFESSCASGFTRFSSNVVSSNTGQVTNTYFNQTCTGRDTITVSLFSVGANTDTDQPLSTARATIATALPKLGFGSGSDFVENIINGNLNLVDEASTKLSATVVDPLNVNMELNSADYYILWSDDCSSDKAIFSIESQNITSAIETRYDADAELCKTPTVTLELFNRFDDSLVSTSASIVLADGLEPAVPLLGVGAELSFSTGELQLSENPIAARQTVEITVNIVDSKNGENTIINDTEYAVEFDSLCVVDGRAQFDVSERRTTSGQVSVYYTASGCTGEDRINATLYSVENNQVQKSSSLAIASTTLTINNPAINSIEYQDMSTRMIAMKGISYSDLPEVSAVKFLVKDEYNNPASGKKVFLSLSNPSVDATLSGIANANGKVEVTTNADGIATAFVNSGTSHGLVSVMAEITRRNYEANEDHLELADTDRIRTQSFGISITTGLPVQPSFTMVANNYNPRGWNKLGEKVEVSVNLNDRFQNPVPDGTIVNFIADGGKVQPSCETVDGTCTVLWSSAKPLPGFNKDNDPLVKQKSNEKNLDGSQQLHPSNNPISQHYFNKHPITGDLLCGDGSLVQDASTECDDYRIVNEDPNWNGGRSGVVTILAYTQGEVDFTDGIGAEGNGRFDEGESFSPMAEAYLDANEDGVYTAPTVNNPFEQLIEFDHNGAYTPAPATYQGGTCTDAARANGHCASPVHIRQSIQLIMASDYVDVRLESIENAQGVTLNKDECINVFNEKKINLNFSVADFNGNTPINGTGISFELDGFTLDNPPSSVGNTNNTYAHTLSVIVEPDDTFSSDSGVLRVAHPDGGDAGALWTSQLTDDPRINILTTDYLMNASETPQIVAFQFLNACGTPPEDSDVVIFEATGVDITTFNENAVITIDDVTNEKSYDPALNNGEPKGNVTQVRPDFFQIYGRELNANGEIFVEISRSVDAAEAAAAEADLADATAAKNLAQTDFDAAQATAVSASTELARVEGVAATAATDLTNAQQAATDAQADLDAAQATHDALPDGHPDKPAAAQAVSDATDAKNTADANVVTAQNAKDTADADVVAATATKNTADANLATAQVELNEAINQLEQAQNASDEATSAANLSEGEVKVRAINRAAEGIEFYKSFSIRL